MTAGIDGSAVQACVVTRLNRREERPETRRMPLVSGAAGEDWKTGRMALLLALFIGPTMLAAVYFGVIAADVYVSQSQFVVRSQGQSGPGRIEEMGEAPAISIGAADVNSVIA